MEKWQIDLLNKIANGEEVPKKIKCFNYNFIYTEDKRPQRFYKLENQDNYLLKDFVYTLNTRVEIIEDEPRDIEVCGSLFTRSEYNKLAGIKEDKKIEKLEILPDNENYSNAVLYGKIITMKKSKSMNMI